MMGALAVEYAVRWVTPLGLTVAAVAYPLTRWRNR